MSCAHMCMALKVHFTFSASHFELHRPTTGRSHKSTKTLMADTLFEALHIVPLPKVDSNNPPIQADYTKAFNKNNK